jgi:FKBP-type peptidyl-prolyl cis-trans isomerase
MEGVKPGINIIEDVPGEAPLIDKKDTISITHSCRLTQGEVIYEDRSERFLVGDRDMIAGLRYGLHGMRIGGRRKFRASPHLCYGEEGVPGKVPKNAVLVFDVHVKEKL